MQVFSTLPQMIIFITVAVAVLKLLERYSFLTKSQGSELVRLIEEAIGHGILKGTLLER